jgi:hypothetical protein
MPINGWKQKKQKESPSSEFRDLPLFNRAANSLKGTVKRTGGRGTIADSK